MASVSPLMRALMRQKGGIASFIMYSRGGQMAPGEVRHQTEHRCSGI